VESIQRREQCAESIDVIVNRHDDVDVVNIRCAAIEGVEKPLLDERASETLFAGPDFATADPSFGDGSRSAGKTQQPPR
jgi:hypothetical protein